MIRITKIEFENYRQYRSATITFPKHGEYDLHVLRAKNGTGKTTFLNGILWCLYGEEYYLNDKDKALPIINSALVKQSQNNDYLSVRVRLTVVDDENTLVFIREQGFHVFSETANPAQISARPEESRLRVVVTSFNPERRFQKNSFSYDDEAQVQSLVKQYFDGTIKEYYFFDGENLKNYFRGNSDIVRSSVFNIAQVTLLENAKDHVRNIADAKYRQAARMGKVSAPDLADEIRKLEESIESKTKENISIDQSIQEQQSIYNEADRALRGYAPIRMNTARRATLERELNELENEYERFKSDKYAFITTYWTLLNFYPRAKTTLRLINEKQESGSLPPNIDKNQIKTLLEEHIDQCPVCHSALDEKALQHLRELLAQLDVSSATSNFLMQIKGGLEDVVRRCTQFRQEFQELIRKEKYYTDTIADKERQIEDINKLLNQYSDESGSINVSKIEEERQKASEKLESLRRRKTLNESDIKRDTETLSKKKEEMDKIEDTLLQKDLLSQQVITFRKLTSSFDEVQSGIMSEIKDEIQHLTWERFNSMIWKKNTFGRVDINDRYEMTVTDLDGKQMTGSLSATEYMALAYSFTLAIHDASGKNCPLVVDSPLGRVSDDNRANMAEELLKVSREKQIIMLFTPDEYSSEVQELYDSNAASNRYFKLSDDESQIIGIGEYRA